MRMSGHFGADEQLEIFANINNLFDREPVITPGAIGRTGVGTGVSTGLYDILGPRFTLGLNYQF